MFKTKTQSGLGLLAVLSLVLAMVLPILIQAPAVSAGQVSSRSITLATSNASASDIVYDISWDAASTSSVGAAVVAVCDSPLVGTTCTPVAGFAFGAQTYANPTGNIVSAADGSFAAGSNYSGDDAIMFTFTPTAPSVGDTFSVDLIATNPSSSGTFYARVLTYANQGAAQDWDDDGTTGTYIDEGGFALSINDQITVTARVQEKLIVCVGQAVPAADCSGYSGDTDVDLDVLDSTRINESDDEGDGNLYLMISSNATGGTDLTYLATEMQVTGASCTGNDINGGAAGDSSDRCLDYDSDMTAGAEGAMSAGTEQFGFAIVAQTDVGTETSDVLGAGAAAAYDDQTTPGGDYSFDVNASSPVSLVDTSQVVDSEYLTFEFAATANLTTPSGLYQTTLTFIATGTY